MGEAILIKALGGAGGSGSEGNTTGAASEGIITTNGFYTCTKTGNYQITCIGGGGGGGAGGGKWLNDTSDDESDWSWYYMIPSAGGSGYMNVINTTLYQNQSYSIIIGEGGSSGAYWAYNSYSNTLNGGNGGITSFSDIISANGGTGGKSTKELKSSKGGSGFNAGQDGWAADYNSGYTNMLDETVNVQGNRRFGGILFYYDATVYNNQISNTNRLYYGDGGDSLYANAKNSYGNAGNAGCVLIKYLG